MIVLLTEPPAGIVSEEGLAERENPCTCTVTVVWHSGPQLGPVIVTMYVPVLELNAVTVRVEFAAPHWLQGGTLTGLGVNVTVGSEGLVGVTVALSGSGPVKRLNVFTVIVELAFWFGITVSTLGLAARV